MWQYQNTDELYPYYSVDQNTNELYHYGRLRHEMGTTYIW